jgi:hypothetical protein
MLSLEASCREQDVVRPLTCLNRFPLPGSADAALYVYKGVQLPSSASGYR